MTLAMDLQIYVEKNKDSWFAEGLAEGEARGRAEGEARGRAEGEARGRFEGKAEGKAEASRDIALRLLMNGVPLEQVALGTGLSVEELQALRQ